MKKLLFAACFTALTGPQLFAATLQEPAAPSYYLDVDFMYDFRLAYVEGKKFEVVPRQMGGPYAPPKFVSVDAIDAARALGPEISRLSNEHGLLPIERALQSQAHAESDRLAALQAEMLALWEQGRPLQTSRGKERAVFTPFEYGAVVTLRELPFPSEMRGGVRSYSELQSVFKLDWSPTRNAKVDFLPTLTFEQQMQRFKFGYPQMVRPLFGPPLPPTGKKQAPVPYTDVNVLLRKTLVSPSGISRVFLENPILTATLKASFAPMAGQPGRVAAKILTFLPRFIR